MATPGKVTLPDEVCQLCTAQLRAGPAALDFLKKCQECGYDVEDQIAAVNAYLDRAAKVKSKFFPQEP